MQFITVLIVIAIFALLYYLRTKLPQIKGRMGEKSVALSLSFLPDEEYIVLNNILLKSGNYSCQMDHIVISIYGIFVIETKTYKGWIYGNTDKQYWTQNIWGNKYRLYNPIWQNEKHVRFLQRILQGQQYPIYSAVVFLNTSSIRLYGEGGNVLWREELKPYIYQYRDIVLSIDDCRRIADYLTQLNVTDKEGRQTHIHYAQQAAMKNDCLTENDRCPRCGGTLIQRHGRYGTFLGCSNYPNCRFTK